MAAKRGRPPKYDSDEALGNAIRVFWAKGLTATSLDDLSDAMNMNRPSIYNAFGGKESIYRKAMARFVDQLGEQLEGILFSEPNVNTALKLFYGSALDTYFSGDEPLGCFVTCTATVEAARFPEIRNDLKLVIDRVDSAFERRLMKALDEGDWPQGKDPRKVAKLLHATLQSVAVRARSGEARASLEMMCSSTVDMFF